VTDSIYKINIELPWRIVAAEATQLEDGSISYNGLNSLTTESGKFCICAFTDFDAADSYLKSLGRQEFVIELSEPQEVLGFLEFERQRFTHVAFDPYVPNRKTSVVPIDNLIKFWKDQLGGQSN
jgi:hypothetical protein